MRGSTSVTRMIKSAERAMWAEVPARMRLWLAARPVYDSLRKVAAVLPGLREAPHIVYVLPDEGRLFVSADVSAERAGSWIDVMEKAGVEGQVCRPLTPTPPGYGTEPWMLVKQSVDVRSVFGRSDSSWADDCFFEDPDALAAVLAGSVLASGAEKRSEYGHTALREALRAAHTLLAVPLLPTLEKAAACLREPVGTSIPAAVFAARVAVDPLLPDRVKAAAAGLVTAAALDREVALPVDIVRVSVGLGASYGDGLRAGRALSELSALSPDVQDTLQKDGSWGQAVAHVVLPILDRRLQA